MYLGFTETQLKEKNLGGKIEWAIERFENQAYLIIQGTRSKFVLDVNGDDPVKKAYESNPKDFGFRRTDRNYRTHSNFRIDIPIPIEVSDDGEKIQAYLNHGNYIVVLPKKIQRPIPNVTKTF